MSADDTTINNEQLLLDLIIEYAEAANLKKWRANVGLHDSSDVFDADDESVIAFTTSGVDHAVNARHIALCCPRTIHKLISELRERRKNDAS